MSQSSKPQTTKSSICNCKQVELKTHGVDKGAVVCHCSNCQKSTGSAFGHNHRFMPGEVEVVKGENLIKKYADSDTQSGNTLYRHFCGNCGSPLYLTNSAFEGLVVLSSGTIEGERSQPSRDFFEENKYSWIGPLASKAKV